MTHHNFSTPQSLTKQSEADLKLFYLLLILIFKECNNPIGAHSLAYSESHFLSYCSSWTPKNPLTPLHSKGKLNKLLASTTYVFRKCCLCLSYFYKIYLSDCHKGELLAAEISSCISNILVTYEGKVIGYENFFQSVIFSNSLNDCMLLKRGKVEEICS